MRAFIITAAVIFLVDSLAKLFMFYSGDRSSAKVADLAVNSGMFVWALCCLAWGGQG